MEIRNYFTYGKECKVPLKSEIFIQIIGSFYDMLIKETALVLLIAAMLITTPALIIVGQLTYAQQASSTNSNVWEQEVQNFKVAIPVNWIGPTSTPEGYISFQSPHGTQTITIAFVFPGLYNLQQWSDAEINELASKGKRPDRDLQSKWQGIHATRILMYPDHISIWIEANMRLYYIAADGATINDQTITEILKSFQIQTPTTQEFQQLVNENNNFYCLALGSISTTYKCKDF